MIDEPAERQLVERFLAHRDEEAFLAIYRNHTPFLYRFLTRLSGGNPQTADEGVQETWIRAVERLGTFAGRSRLRTWLAGIAIHWFREQMRRRHDGSVELSEDSMPVPPAGNPIDRLVLERAVLELPEGYRAALVLHDIEGFTHEETAALLGVDVGTSKSQVSRARRSLRLMLQTGGKPV